MEPVLIPMRARPMEGVVGDLLLVGCLLGVGWCASTQHGCCASFFSSFFCKGDGPCHWLQSTAVGFDLLLPALLLPKALSLLILVATNHTPNAWIGWALDRYLTLRSLSRLKLVFSNRPVALS